MDIVKVIINIIIVVEEVFLFVRIVKENIDKVVFIEFGFKLIYVFIGDDIYY